MDVDDATREKFCARRIDADFVECHVPSGSKAIPARAFRSCQLERENRQAAADMHGWVRKRARAYTHEWIKRAARLAILWTIARM